MGKKLYYNGTVITMENCLYAQAVLTEGDKICAVGNLDDLELISGQAQRIDLQGHILMPAFIDAHSHFSACANALLQCSVEKAKDFNEIIGMIREYIDNSHIEKGQWVMVRDYDQSVLVEKCKPDKYILDQASAEHPIILQHKSGHVGAVNSMALKKLGLDFDTPDPQGGRMERANGELTGYLEENAFIHVLHQLPGPSQQDFINAFERVQKMYASYGIATVQEGMMVSEMIPLYRYLCGEHKLWLDVVAYTSMDCRGEIYEAFPDHDKVYKDHFKLGGFKIFLDGSPQSKTAWTRQPYVGGNDCGYPVQSLESVADSVYAAASSGRQILAHCNGDAAAQQYLDAIVKVNGRLKMATHPAVQEVAGVRPVMVHAQLLGIDQIPLLKSLGVIPSFFPAHVYYWGDTHIANLGFERASMISPSAGAIAVGLPYTFHQDSPVIKPDMLETIWCAVNRKTRGGKTLGEHQKISVLDSLKAVTVNSAWQYFEENSKGSLAPGKKADFVILDNDPLNVPKDSIREICVLETIKDGESIYTSET